MNFAQATQSPIIENIGGVDVSFTPLSISDYIPWAAELHRSRSAASKKLIPTTADPIDQFRMKRMAEFDEPSLAAIADLVWTPSGAMRVIKTSLDKTVGEADRDTILKAISPRRIVPLAVDVSALFEAKIPEKPVKGKPDPNDEPAQSQSADLEEIG